MKNVARFTIKVNAASKSIDQVSEGKTREQLREQFWNAKLLYITENKRIDPDEAEAGLKNSFGRLLTQHLRYEYPLPITKRFFFSKRSSNYDQPQKISFVVEKLNYGSLDVVMKILGADNMPKIFPDSESFEAFLQSYVPTSFANSTGVFRGAEALNFDYQDLGEVRAILDNSTGNSATKQRIIGKPVESNSGSKFSYWMVANFSLLPAVAIGAFFTYLAHEDVSKSRQDLMNNQQMFSNRVDAHLNTLSNQLENSRQREERLVDKITNVNKSER